MSCMCDPCCGTTPEEDERFLDLLHNEEIPVKNRKQTDLHCFITLAVFFSLLVISVSVAGGIGDIRRFIYDIDDNGNLCGFKNDPIEGVPGSGLDLTRKKYLLTSKSCNWQDDYCWIKTECVEECINGYTFSFTPRCIPEKPKKKWYDDATEETKSELEEKSIFEIVVSDISLCWREIIVLCFVSICLSGLLMTVLRIFPHAAIKVILGIICAVSVKGTIISWAFVIIKAQAAGDATGVEKKEREKEMESWIAITAVTTTFTIVFFFVLFRMRKKLRLISVLFEEGGKCIKDIPMLLLQPVLTQLINGILVCLVMLGFVCLETSGSPTQDKNGSIYFPVPILFQISSWLLLFGFLWLSQFFLACQNLVIAGAVSSWYFSRVKGQLFDPVWKSFCMIVKHHLGSAAFGSMLIAIVKAIRMIFKMMERKGRENGFAFLIFSILKCVFICLESILKILNKSAYVMIVLFGDPFCVSARRAFACLTADSSRIALVIGGGAFILSAIQLLIAFSVSFVGVAIFMNIKGLVIFWIPATLVFLLSFVCSHCFFSVYEMTIDTLILCFCVDQKMNDGLEKPYYMNKNLMIFNEDTTEVTVPGNGNDNNQLIQKL